MLGHSEGDPHITLMFQDQFEDVRLHVIAPSDVEDASVEPWVLQFEGPLPTGGRAVVSLVSTPMEIHRLLIESMAAMLNMHCHEGQSHHGIDIDASRN